MTKAISQDGQELFRLIAEKVSDFAVGFGAVASSLAARAGVS